ncbi:MAG TPA: hypothetical protein VM889_04530 [Candidatus Thermoplasmatota archaeon]|nr:hypothetical protein [Candidatus Thermoplasmatota archaeon]
MRALAIALIVVFSTVPALAEDEPVRFVTVHFAQRAGLSAPVDVATDDFSRCDVVVRKGSDGGVILDAAVAAGCLESWTWCRDAGNGRFVTSLDGRYGDGRHDANGDPCPSVFAPGKGVGTGLTLVFWSIHLNGEPAASGIDGYAAAEGDVYEFEYTTWLGYLVALP